MPDLRKGGRKINVFQVLIGGSGGRPHCDGFDGTDYSFAFLRNTPAETIEAEMDLIVHEYRYMQDSGGAGTYRGGLGVGITIEALVPNTIVTMRGMERTRFAPWGVHGGRFGGNTSPAIINGGKPHERRIPKLDVLVLNRGDTLQLGSSGGGGYGDPCGRDPEKVRSDVQNGFVSDDHALNIYGVVLRGPDLEVDLAATEKQRKKVKESRNVKGRMYDYGPEREHHDEIWSPSSRGAIMKILNDLPIPARAYAKQFIMRKAKEIYVTDSLPAITEREIGKSWDISRVELGLDS
jgi:N-methylhydantoinase B